ncbi:uncharacterized protein LOC133886386 [Phragmites australis]|uniref:uncharacterized protein LOC133886386 n=1 Tax=Phragmites australis TaxID=29695 RepID=UPI002D796D59|nr:uncharacterized protein LOC133886386 [Phragmites australis]
MSISMLKDIHPRGRHWTVCTRLSRMWDYRGGTDDGDVRHVDLVLLDAEGTAMYAQIGSNNVKDKQPLFAEGKVYMLKRFRVLKSKPSYWPVDNEFMIEITCHTLIEEKHDFESDFPMYTYNLTKFPDLPSLVGETKCFVDIIGLITEVADTTTVQLHNQSRATVRRAITLRDTSNYEIKLYLWGKRASEFDADKVYAVGQEQPVIAIFVGTLMKSYKDEHSLSGNTSCQWYINPDVPEVQAVIDRYKICLMGTDGTDEAEFVFFGDMGRRLVLKDVNVLMRSCRSADGIPSEIASLVSQKYHFTVNVTSRCFEKPQRSYEVKHIHCAYGQQTTIPTVKKPSGTPTDDKHKAVLSIVGSSSAMQPHKDQHVQNVKDTPPPKDSLSFTPLKTKQPLSEHPSDGKKERNIRRRLLMDRASTDANLDKHDDSLDDNLEDSLGDGTARSLTGSDGDGGSDADGGADSA